MKVKMREERVKRVARVRRIVRTRRRIGVLYPPTTKLAPILGKNE